MRSTRLHICLMAALALVVVASFWTATTALRQLRAGASAECARVQVLRTQDNDVARVSHDVLQQAARQILANPARTATGEAVARTYLLYSRRLTYIPTTNCSRALSDPVGYRPPRPRHFPDLH